MLEIVCFIFIVHQHQSIRLILNQSIFRYADISGNMLYTISISQSNTSYKAFSGSNWFDYTYSLHTFIGSLRCTYVQDIDDIIWYIELSYLFMHRFMPNQHKQILMSLRRRSFDVVEATYIFAPKWVIISGRRGRHEIPIKHI